MTAQCLITKRADEDRGPYLDLLREFDINHQGRMYISRSAVEDMVSAFSEAGVDLDTPGSRDLVEMTERAEGAEAELVELASEVESLREFEQSARYTMDHFGEKVRKKPGRKPSPEKELSHG